MQTKDILDLDNIGSVVRKVFEERGEIRLEDFDNERANMPEDYTIESIDLESTEYKHVRKAIEPISEKFEEEGYGPQIYTALYEAVLNAFQHGNQRDPSKEIKVGFKISDNQLDIMVEDQGGRLDPHFLPYVLEQREERYKEHFINFYEFSNKEKENKENMGSGTMFMHQYTDKVSYYHSENGGLIVHMIKTKG